MWVTDLLFPSSSQGAKVCMAHQEMTCSCLYGTQQQHSAEERKGWRISCRSFMKEGYERLACHPSCYQQLGRTSADRRPSNPARTTGAMMYANGPRIHSFEVYDMDFVRDRYHRYLSFPPFRPSLICCTTG